MNKRIKKKKEKQRMVARQKLYVVVKETIEGIVFCLGESFISFAEKYASALAEKITSELFLKEKEQ